MAFKLTPGHINQLKAGEEVYIDYEGKTYALMEGLIQHGEAELQAGHDVSGLVPTWVDGAYGPMDLIWVYA